jgi:hypothetical protein
MQKQFLELLKKELEINYFNFLSYLITFSLIVSIILTTSPPISTSLVM